MNFQLNLAVWFVFVRMECRKVRFTSVKRKFVCIQSITYFKGPSKRLQHLVQHLFDFVERCWKVVE